jgi:hypothetical protein
MPDKFPRNTTDFPKIKKRTYNQVDLLLSFVFNLLLKIRRLAGFLVVVAPRIPSDAG